MEKEVRVGIKADSTGFGPAMQAAAANVEGAAKSMSGSLGSMTSAAKSANLALVALAAAAAIGGALEALVSHVTELGVQFAKASVKTGIAASSLSSLAYAAEASDTSFQVLVKGLTMLDRNLLLVVHGTGPAADAFRVLGVHVKDASGNLKSNEVLLGELADKFAAMPDGPLKTALAMRIFGRAGAEMIPILDQGSKGIAQLKADSDALGATMSGPLIDSTEKYHHTMVKFHALMTGIGNMLAEKLIPVFNSLVQHFESFALRFGHGIKELNTEVDTFERVTVDAFTSVGNALTLAAQGQFKLAATTLSQMGDRVKKAWHDSSVAVAADQVELKKQLDVIWRPDEKEKKPKGESGPAPDLSGITQMAKMKEAWDVKAEQLRTADKALGEDLTAQERQYWQGILELTTTKGADRVAIKHHLYTLETKEAKDAMDVQLATEHEKEAEVTGTAVDQARARIVIKKSELATIVGFYGAYSKEAIAAERAIAQETMTLDKAIAAEKKHLLEEEKKAKAAAAAEEKKALLAQRQLWKEHFAALSQTFKTTFDGFLRGTQTFAQSFQHLALGLGADFAKMLAKMIAQWALHESIKTGILSTSLATRLGLETAGRVTGAVAKTAAAVGQVTSDASVGAAGAASAVAGIPIVGPSLAPAAAAATFAEIMGFMSGAVMSAAGGYNIPAGVNPLTQLHQQEMVLPAELAERVRGMSGGGGGGGDIHIHAMDVKSFHDYVQANHGAVTAALKKGARMGAITMTPAGVLR